MINPPKVQYKGDDLDPERGPGLGCFRFQLAVLVFFIVLTPLTVVWQWPSWISSVLLFAIVGLLLVAGQTVIFLLRLVAADRRSRRRPLASATKTVGELDDEQAETQAPDAQARTADPARTEDPARTDDPPPPDDPVRMDDTTETDASASHDAAAGPAEGPMRQ